MQLAEMYSLRQPVVRETGGLGEILLDTVLCGAIFTPPLFLRLILSSVSLHQAQQHKPRIRGYLA